jgi:hypothetical protein
LIGKAEPIPPGDIPELLVESPHVVIFARVTAAATSDCKRVRDFIAASPRTLFSKKRVQLPRVSPWAIFVSSLREGWARHRVLNFLERVSRMAGLIGRGFLRG